MNLTELLALQARLDALEKRVAELEAKKDSTLRLKEKPDGHGK